MVIGARHLVDDRDCGSRHGPTTRSETGARCSLAQWTLQLARRTELGFGELIGRECLKPRSDLYDGTSGLAFFLGELFEATGDEELRRAALGAVGHALADSFLFLLIVVSAEKCQHSTGLVPCIRDETRKGPTRRAGARCSVA